MNHSKNWLVVFGCGSGSYSDIFISNECNTSDNRCNLGRTYNPLGMKLDSDEARNYLAGKF